MLRLFWSLPGIGRGWLFIGLWLILAQPTFAQTPERPLILPLQGAPGLNSWLFGQPYGNTVGAYNFGTEWYSAGQGLHFGLDFPAPCGTPLVAAADGTVMFVDNFSFGSRPHNLLIRHDALGLVSLYGHLLETPDLVAGQPVVQGQVVGYSGDPDVTCESRPHLHYELRSLDYRTAYNPIPYIDTHWHSLALIGGFDTTLFQQDLDNARRWMSLEDQPNVQFGGGRLNAYAAYWPLAYGMRPPSNARPERQLPALGEAIQVSLQRIGYDQCCQDFWWDATKPVTLYTVDGAPGQRAIIFAWSADTLTLDGQLGAAPRPILAPDGTHEIVVANNQVFIRRLTDGVQWPVPVPAQGNLPGISPDNARLVWVVQGSVVPPGQEQPNVEIYTSDISGQNIKTIPALPGTGAMWLDATRLLLMINQRPNTTLEIYDTATGQRLTLGTWYRLRGLSASPGGSRLLFYLANQADSAASGIYTLATQPGAQPERLDWFGSWRWRDANSVYYIPFDPVSGVQQLAHYDFTTRTTRLLTDPAAQPFAIMNARWEVAPDGRHIAFHNLQDRNLWLLRVEG